MRNRAAKLHTLEALGIAIFCLTLSGLARAQDITNSSNIGFPENGIFVGSDFDNVQTANGNLHVHVPLLQLKGRGPTLSFDFHYNGFNYYFTERCGDLTCSGTWHLGGGGGWMFSSSIAYSLSAKIANTNYCGTNTPVMAYTGFVMSEPDGTQHQFVPDSGKIVQPGGIICFSPITNGLIYASDGSGWMARVDPNTGNPAFNGWNYDLVRKDGTEIKSIGTTVTLTDPNGNQLIGTTNGTTVTITDTLGRAVSWPTNTTGAPPSEIDYTDSNGTAQKILIATTNVSTASNFDCGGDSPCHQATGFSIMPAQITLPNGVKYTFTYPNTTYQYGELSSATLPTGATVSWTWQLSTLYNIQVTSRTVNANGQNYLWTYNYGAIVGGVKPTTVTDPALNDIRYSCSGEPAGGPDFASYGCQPVKVEYFSGSATTGTLTKTVTTDYDGTNTTLPIRETTTWAQTNQVTKIETDWDSFNTGQRTITWRNPINKREYAFGPSTPGGLVRTTHFDYLHLTTSSYRLANIADRATDKFVYEADGTTVHAKTYFSYDNTTLTSTSGVVNHDYTNFSSTNTLRGNSTQIQNWRNTDNTFLSTYNYYNDAGDLLQTKDPKNNSTYFDYTDSWYQNTCAPGTGSTLAFVTKTTNALSQISTAKYDSCSSLVGSTTDLNGQTTTYAYDLMGRRTQISMPDGGQVSVVYGASVPITNQTTTKITLSVIETSTAVLEDRGLVKQTQLNSAPGGSILTDTTYDGFGRVITVSNPYQGTSTGTITNQYDALGRIIQVTKQDGSLVKTAYCGSTTLVTDEAGHWRRSTTDALGRLIEVDEPNSTTATVNPNGCPGTGEPIWVTTYGYDVLANLTSVTQGGSHGRSFAYDSLGHLTSSQNPETGTTPVTYTYDNNGNVATKKDARNITITYSYDVLNRLSGRTYSNSDPSVTYTYDQTACLGQPTCFNIGRRTSMTDAGGSESVSYDKMGRELTHQRTTNSITKTTSYTYNLNGSLATLVYPSGRTITYAYDAAARPISGVDSANSINYATAGAYAPQGALSALTLGSSTGFAGVNLSNTYNSRLQPNEVKAWSTAGTAFDLIYCFNAWNASTNACSTTAGSNNGNVNGITNNKDGTRTQFFGYDQVNRIATGSTIPSCGTNCWGLTFGYDQWANLTTATATGSATPLNLTVNGNNQITTSGFTYDASGNLTADVTSAYAWNAESEIKTAAGVNYAYDGDGNRVQKSNGKIYWYGAGTEILDESDGFGNITDEYVFFGGKRVAHRSVSSGSITYYAEDFLGSTRVMTTSAGAVCYDADFYPYGGENLFTSTCAQNYKFEGKERDTETGNDDFGARYYSSVYGRWLSPDWSSVPAPVPYAILNNPQTLNLYAMVSDNPESFEDLDGHDPSPYIGDAAGWYAACRAHGCPAAKKPDNTQQKKRDDQKKKEDPDKDKKDPQEPRQGQQPQSGQGGQTQQPQSNGTTKPEKPIVGLAGVAAAAAGAGSELGPGDVVVVGVAVGIYLAVKNKDAIIQVKGQLENAAAHIGFLNNDPAQDPRNKWRKEARTSVDKARKWADRMSDGSRKDAVNALIDIVERAIPEN